MLEPKGHNYVLLVKVAHTYDDLSFPIVWNNIMICRNQNFPCLIFTICWYKNIDKYISQLHVFVNLIKYILLCDNWEYFDGILKSYSNSKHSFLFISYFSI